MKGLLISAYIDMDEMMSNNEVFYKLAEKANEAFFIYDPIGERFKYLNAALQKMLDLPTNDLVAASGSLFDLVYPDDRNYLRSQIHELKIGTQINAEFRLMAGGHPLYVQLIAYYVEDDVIGWISDINNIKRNILYAEKINARKNSLLEILAHDLKEPVGMINMIASAIKKEPAIANDEVLEGYIRTIQQLCESNIGLIRNMVSQEFLEAQEIELRSERTDLVWAVRDVMQQYQRSASLLNKNFYFQTSLPQIFVRMDTLKLIQVVNNLVSNAIKFTPDGGHISIDLSEVAEGVRLSITDDGIGIPAELRPYLFNPHTPAQRLGIRGETGSGMGLSIIRTLIELHGGRVWLDEGKNDGSTFHIEIPKAH